MRWYHWALIGAVVAVAWVIDAFRDEQAPSATRVRLEDL